MAIVKPSFSKLKADYPTELHPEGNFPSCAVRMSMCLHKQGIFNKEDYKKHTKRVSRNGWAMVAEELYQWLRSKSSLGPALLLKEAPKRNGIVYLRNCWRSDGMGDHFDLYLYDPSDGYFTIMTNELWPDQCDNGIVLRCRDKTIRFWDCGP